mmetsp:Transcript_1094/g.2379  ORF Transcript_1094/g.2379 Transcript_1094/m.2379 type:complete len:410 (-) Transcript_1094:898-2127(-)
MLLLRLRHRPLRRHATPRWRLPSRLGPWWSSPTRGRLRRGLSIMPTLPGRLLRPRLLGTTRVEWARTTPTITATTRTTPTPTRREGTTARARTWCRRLGVTQAPSSTQRRTTVRRRARALPSARRPMTGSTTPTRSSALLGRLVRLRTARTALKAFTARARRQRWSARQGRHRRSAPPLWRSASARQATTARTESAARAAKRARTAPAGRLSRRAPRERCRVLGRTLLWTVCACRARMGPRALSARSAPQTATAPTASAPSRAPQARAPSPAARMCLTASVRLERTQRAIAGTVLNASPTRTAPARTRSCGVPAGMRVILGLTARMTARRAARRGSMALLEAARCVLRASSARPGPRKPRAALPSRQRLAVPRVSVTASVSRVLSNRATATQRPVLSAPRIAIALAAGV